MYIQQLFDKVKLFSFTVDESEGQLFIF